MRERKNENPIPTLKYAYQSPSFKRSQTFPRSRFNRSSIVQRFRFFSESTKKPSTVPGRGLFPMGQIKGCIKSLDCSRPLNNYLRKAGLIGEIVVLQSMQIAISFVNLYEPHSRHFVLPNSSISLRYLSISFPHFCQYFWSISKSSFILKLPTSLVN